MTSSRDAAAERLDRSRRGSVALQLAILLVAVVGFVALGTEIVSLLFISRGMQSAADAAALGGARARLQGFPADYTQEAIALAANAGFVNGQGGTSVAVNSPPAGGHYAGVSGAVEVVIAQPQNLVLASALHSGPFTVSGRAVAIPTSSPNCIYILAASGSGVLHTEGGTSINATCGTFANSSSPTAATISGSLNTPSFAVVGGYTGTVNSSQIQTGVPHIKDPLWYLAAPAFGGCDYTNYSLSSGTATLNPGVYCGGNGNAAIDLTGSAQVTLNPGTYVLNGGGLNMGGNATLGGTGVTIYNTGTASTYAPINTQDQITIALKAPTSGPLEGILFFTDRSVTFPTQANNIGMGNTGKLEGTLYFPTTDLVMDTGQNSAAYTILVTKTLSLGINTFNVSSDYSSLQDGSPLKAAKLAE